MLTLRSLAGALALAAMFSLAGCSKTEAPAVPMAAAPAASMAAAAPAARPASQQGTLTIEGAAQPFDFNLFDGAAAGLPLAFTTYVPADMLAEANPAGETPAVRFVGNFGGVRQDQAYLEITFLPVGLTEAEALAAAALALPDGVASQTVADTQRRYSWSVREYGPAETTGTDPAMLVALGRHGERWFRLNLHYPRQFGDGFVPRAQSILDAWRWSDTGQGL